MAVHISTVLRAGVTLATAFVLFGATLYLSRHGTTEPLYEAFTGEPEALRSVAGIWGAALSGSGRGVIQLGLLVLLATPIARVALSFVTFAAILDRTYVVAAGIVLAMLCLGLAGGPA
ncbi:MAG: DUF1634 domain-containing protein [Deltaproteobacteria bacterium]|nr:DUF1634 domain-containing protein [Deltaproteobacteria bacterium]